MCAGIRAVVGSNEAMWLADSVAATAKKALPGGRAFLHRVARRRGRWIGAYFGGGAGMNPSRLRPGSGFGLGLGAFFTSFLPLSLLPMIASVPQMGG